MKKPFGPEHWGVSRQSKRASVSVPHGQNTAAPERESWPGTHSLSPLPVRPRGAGPGFHRRACLSGSLKNHQGRVRKGITCAQRDHGNAREEGLCQTPATE